MLNKPRFESEEHGSHSAEWSCLFTGNRYMVMHNNRPLLLFTHYNAGKKPAIRRIDEWKLVHFAALCNKEKRKVGKFVRYRIVFYQLATKIGKSIFRAFLELHSLETFPFRERHNNPAGNGARHCCVHSRH